MCPLPTFLALLLSGNSMQFSRPVAAIFAFVHTLRSSPCGLCSALCCDSAFISLHCSSYHSRHGAVSVPLPAARAPGGHTWCLSPALPPARCSGVSVLQEACSKPSLSCSRWLLSGWRFYVWDIGCQPPAKLCLC